MIGSFHFIRPWWLLALLPAALMLWRLALIRGSASRWRNIVAPHLLSHLLIRPADHRRGAPLLLLGAAWLLAVIATAGPTWRREPSPFAQDVGTIIFVIKVTPSMRSTDVQPDRFTRSVQKIHDLLAARPGVKAALIAYAGSAHAVVPLTSDADIINMFAPALDPTIMPIEGDHPASALQLAESMLDKAGQAASIIWITDAVSPGAAKPLANLPHSEHNIRLLAPVHSEAQLNALRTTAQSIGAQVLQVTPDDSDINQLARDTRFAESFDASQSRQWHESGFLLIPLLAAIALAWFRPGTLGAFSSAGRGEA